MKQLTELQPATPETVWAILREAVQLHKENEFYLNKMREEFQQMRNENEQNAKKEREEREQLRKEEELKAKKEREEREQLRKEEELKAKKEEEKYERRLQNMEERVGAWSRSHGNFAEEYFFNSFENDKQNFFGEEFDEIEKNFKFRKGKVKYEFDIVMYNCTSIAIVEVKYKAHQNDIPFVQKQAETFRIVFPEYKEHKIYLGLASMSFYPELERDCINAGIAIVKQLGDTVVINDAHLKTY